MTTALPSVDAPERAVPKRAPLPSCTEEAASPTSPERFLEEPQTAHTNSEDGTYRARTLHDTLQLLWNTREDYGVTRVWEITGLDRLGYPVHVVARPGAHPNNLTVSNGKGLSPIASLVSGLAEAFERHWGEPQHHRLLRASTLELREAGRAFVHPSLLGVSTRSDWTELTTTEWLEFVSLSSGERRLVPADYAIAPYRTPGGATIRRASTDGIACGNTVAEAALHAVLELIERDACSFGLWTHAGWAIDLETIPPTASDIVKACERAGVEARIYRFPALLDIPVYYATLDDTEARNPMLICAGAGAHIDGRIAVTRALTEAMQSRLCAISGGREDLSPKYAQNRHAGYSEASSSLARWAGRFPPGDFVRFGTITLSPRVGGLLGALVEGLASSGFADVYVRELSPADGQMHVVSAAIPGVELIADAESPAGRRFRAALKAEVSRHGREGNR